MDKETSARVSGIAARILNVSADDIRILAHHDDAGPGANHPTNGETLQDFVDAIHSLAGSCMSQDETPGQEAPKHDYFTRLKKEREELDTRLTALNSFLTHNPGDVPNERQRPLLETQAKLMGEYLHVLDTRISEILIDQRSATTEKEG